MSTIEMRLTGRQTTAAGIVRAVHPLLSRGPIARVELRLSTKTSPRVHEADVRRQVAQLLREHGHALAAVSVRAHEGAMDDATGEHLLRIVPDERRGAVPVAPAWRRGLARWLPRWFATTPLPLQVPRQDPALPASAPAPAQPDPRAVTEAVKKLRQAVVKAVDFMESPNGTDIVGREGGAQTVGRAHIVVRLQGLHAVLEPLVRQDSRAIGQMVKGGGMALAPNFGVDYAFEPSRSGAGTSFASESDIEVRLLLAGSTEGTAQTTSQASRAPVVRTLRPEISASSQCVQYTARPTEAEPAAPALIVRVLGTMDTLFAQPFDLPFDRLPAQLDRNALQGAGFGEAHPDLLIVASNSCPLRFDAGQDGQVLMQASTWSDSAGRQLPMYFARGTLAGIYGERQLAAEGELVVVNAPGGVQDPISGRRMPALVVQLLPVNPQTVVRQAPWVAEERAA